MNHSTALVDKALQTLWIQTIAHSSSSDDSWHTLKTLLPHIQSSAPTLLWQQDQWGWTPLERACRQSQNLAIDLAKALQHSTVIDDTTRKHTAQLALESACYVDESRWDAPAVVQALLDLGADINAPRHNHPSGDTPLHISARQMNYGLCQCLVLHGANHTRNAQGDLPSDVAQNNGMHQWSALVSGADTPIERERLAERLEQMRSSKAVTQKVLDSLTKANHNNTPHSGL